MFNKVKNLSFLVLFVLFIFSITRHYFSEQNVIFTNKSRTSYSLKLYDGKINLPILKNDTNNIIVYMNDLEDFKKNRKKRFWEGLISNKNE